MMETSDEWITTRTGIKERRILPKDRAVIHVGEQVVQDLLKKNDLDPASIDMLICATCTGDYIMPDSANSICYKAGLTKAFGFDLNAACSGFVFALHTATQFIQAGTYKRIIVIGAEKMSSYMNYQDRTTSIIFGDGGGGILLEASDDQSLGVIDAVLKGDGSGCEYLNIAGGGSLYPDGKRIFKRAVTGMYETIEEVMKRNDLKNEDIDWIVPHQANDRILSAVAGYLDYPYERVMNNIARYGNTSAGTIPLCLWEYEDKLKKGDGIMFTAFGGGFTWGSLFLRWAY
ncbi:UNVERIFIED_CONTAM: hypothetical protein GTU68_058125 [Idotea baltica]|nr:hypothetical protein [Idotea baltica]